MLEISTRLPVAAFTACQLPQRAALGYGKTDPRVPLSKVMEINYQTSREYSETFAGKLSRMGDSKLPALAREEDEDIFVTRERQVAKHIETARAKNTQNPG